MNDDIYRGLYWRDPDHPDDPDECYLVMKVTKWSKLSSDESYPVIKEYSVMNVTQWSKLSSDESYLAMKVSQWWKSSSDESFLVMKVFSDKNYLVLKVI